MDAKKIFTAHSDFFQSHARLLSVSERKKSLRKIDRWIVSHEGAIIESLRQDFRKPEPETLLSEIKMVRDELSLIRQSLASWARPKTTPNPLTLIGSRSQVYWQPKGPALIIGAWNYPFTLTIGPLLGAIAAGCTAVVKPSELAPATSQLVADLVADCFDPNYITVVQGGIPETQALLEQPWGHIFFTGSKRVGRIVMEAAAQNLSSVTLELGGENPVLIDKSANLSAAAAQLVWGKFFNAGQTCIAPNHLFIDRAVYDDFLEALQTALTELYAREKNQPGTDVACLIGASHYQRMQQLLSDAEAQGAQVVVKGQQQSNANYFGPTIVKEVPLNSPLVQEEVFGPILSCIPYDDIQTVYDHIDSQDAALALYVFARNRRFIDQVIAHTTAGTTVVNTVNIQFANPHLPFGGVGKSGVGKGHGWYSYAAFSHPRAVVRQGPLALNRWIFPPYTPAKERVVRWLYRWF